MGRRGEMGRTAPVTDNEHGWICGTGSILLRLKPVKGSCDYESASAIISKVWGMVLKDAFFTDGATKIVEISEIVDGIRIGPFGTMLHKSDYITGGNACFNMLCRKASACSRAASTVCSILSQTDIFLSKYAFICF